MGEITPVYDIDGRVIGEGKCGAITAKIQAAYRSKTEYEGTPLPDF
jgi:branched-subunit amino acid aminotransferase/4-amino-4-deoxychorismate lyase